MLNSRLWIRTCVLFLTCALSLPVHLWHVAVLMALGVSSSSLGPEPARRPFAIPCRSPTELLPMLATARLPYQVAWLRPEP